MESVNGPEVVLRLHPVVVLSHRVYSPRHTGQLQIVVLILRVQRVRLRRHLWIVRGGREVVLRQDDGPGWRRHAHRVPVRRFHDRVL